MHLFYILRLVGSEVKRSLGKKVNKRKGEGVKEGGNERLKKGTGREGGELGRGTYVK